MLAKSGERKENFTASKTWHAVCFNTLNSSLVGQSSNVRWGTHFTQFIQAAFFFFGRPFSRPNWQPGPTTDQFAANGRACCQHRQTISVRYV